METAAGEVLDDLRGDRLYGHSGAGLAESRQANDGLRGVRRVVRELNGGPLRRFSCATCAYGASAADPPPRCPMCGETEWEHEQWRPFTGLAADLRPRHQVTAGSSAASMRSAL